jgi:hypothetical protein
MHFMIAELQSGCSGDHKLTINRTAQTDPYSAIPG